MYQVWKNSGQVSECVRLNDWKNNHGERSRIVTNGRKIQENHLKIVFDLIPKKYVQFFSYFFANFFHSQLNQSECKHCKQNSNKRKRERKQLECWLVDFFLLILINSHFYTKNIRFRKKNVINFRAVFFRNKRKIYRATIFFGKSISM